MEELTNKYPYYIPGLVVAYHASKPGSDSRRLLRGRIIANIGDPGIVARLLPEEETEESKKERGDNVDPIDSFLSKFGNDPRPLGYMKDLIDKENPGKGEKEKPTFEGNIELSLRELIKKERYSEALAIIEEQNLNNPEKNIYFADQIRFLRKLISIKNYKKQPKD